MVALVRTLSRQSAALNANMASTGKQQYGFASASQRDKWGHRRAPSWRVTNLFCQEAYADAVVAQRLPKMLLDLVADTVNVVPVAVDLYESDDTDRRTRDAVTGWVDAAVKDANEGSAAAQLVLCVWGKILSSFFEKVFVNNNIADDVREQRAKVVFIVQSSNARDGLEKLEEIGVFQPVSCSVKDASLVPAPETALNAGTRANLQSTGGLFILYAQLRYLVMFSFWVGILGCSDVRPSCTDFLARRILADVEFPLGTPRGLAMHESLRSTAGEAAATRALAALDAQPSMTLENMAVLLANDGVDLEVSVQEWLAARADARDDPMAT